MLHWSYVGAVSIDVEGGGVEILVYCITVEHAMRETDRQTDELQSHTTRSMR